MTPADLFDQGSVRDKIFLQDRDDSVQIVLAVGVGRLSFDAPTAVVQDILGRNLATGLLGSSRRSSTRTSVLDDVVAYVPGGPTAVERGQRRRQGFPTTGCRGTRTTGAWRSRAPRQ